MSGAAAKTVEQTPGGRTQENVRGGASATLASAHAPGVRHSIQALQRAVGNRTVANLLSDDSDRKGESLPEPVQTMFSRKFGQDLSHVKVHRDGKAAESARRIGANAFARGADLYFREGAFQPESSAGQALLAHELAHVVQQTRSEGSPAAGSSTSESDANRASLEHAQGSGTLAAGHAAPVAVAADTGVVYDDDELKASGLSAEDLALSYKEAIVVQDKGLHQYDDVLKAANNGLINLDTPAQYEKQLRREIAQGSTEYASSWTPDDMTDWEMANETPEQADISQSKWAVYVDRKYMGYLQGKAAEWEHATRIMDACATAGNWIAGGTLAVPVLVAAPVILPEAAVVGTEAATVGTEVATVGTEVATVGTEAATVGTEAATVGTEAAATGEASSLTGRAIYAARYLYLNAPQLASSVGLYGGAAVSGVALAQHVQQIRNQGVHWSDIPQFAEDLMPAAEGYVGYQPRSSSGSGPAPSPGVANQAPDPAEVDFVHTAFQYNSQTGKLSGSIIQPNGTTHDWEIDRISGDGQIVNRATGEVVGTVTNGNVGPTRAPAAGLLPSGESEPTAGAPPANTVGPSSEPVVSSTPGVSDDLISTGNNLPPSGPTSKSGDTGGGVNPPDEPDLFGDSETGPFRAEGPVVRTPVSQPGQPSVPLGRPACVLQVGAGAVETDLGLPPDSDLVEVTSSDINPSRPGVCRLDAQQPVPDEFAGQFDSVLINNPRRYTPNIGELGRALQPGGRIIVQGRGEVYPGQRGINPDFNRMLNSARAGEAPPGFSASVDLEPGPVDTPTTPEHILGGPFYSTTGEPLGGGPNGRIIYEKATTSMPEPPGPDAPPAAFDPGEELTVGGTSSAEPIPDTPETTSQAISEPVVSEAFDDPEAAVSRAAADPVADEPATPSEVVTAEARRAARQADLEQQAEQAREVQRARNATDARRRASKQGIAKRKKAGADNLLREQPDPAFQEHLQADERVEFIESRGRKVPRDTNMHHTRQSSADPGMADVPEHIQPVTREQHRSGTGEHSRNTGDVPTAGIHGDVTSPRRPIFDPHAETPGGAVNPGVHADSRRLRDSATGASVPAPGGPVDAPDITAQPREQSFEDVLNEQSARDFEAQFDDLMDYLSDSWDEE